MKTESPCSSSTSSSTNPVCPRPRQQERQLHQKVTSSYNASSLADRRSCRNDNTKHRAQHTSSGGNRSSNQDTSLTNSDKNSKTKNSHRKSLLAQRYRSNIIGNHDSCDGAMGLSWMQQQQHPFQYYWCRPLGAPDSCRRFTLQRVVVTDGQQKRGTRMKRMPVWALPLRNWSELEQAILDDTRDSSNVNTRIIQTLEVEGSHSDWIFFVSQFDIYWHRWLDLLQQQLPALDRLVFLWDDSDNPENDNNHNNGDGDVKLDVACLLIRRLFAGEPLSTTTTTTKCLRHVEFRDRSNHPCTDMIQRLQLLSSQSTCASSDGNVEHRGLSMRLQSMVWDASASMAKLESSTLQQQQQLATLWIQWIQEKQQHSVRSLKFMGNWHAIFLNHSFDCDRGFMLSFLHALEQAPYLEELELSGGGNGGVHSIVLQTLQSMNQKSPQTMTTTPTTLPIRMVQQASSVGGWYGISRSHYLSQSMRNRRDEKSDQIAAAAATAQVQFYFDFLTRLHWLRRLYRQYHTWCAQKLGYSLCWSKPSKTVDITNTTATTRHNSSSGRCRRTLDVAESAAALGIVEAWYRDTHRPWLLSHAAATVAAVQQQQQRSTEKTSSSSVPLSPEGDPLNPHKSLCSLQKNASSSATSVILVDSVRPTPEGRSSDSHVPPRGYPQQNPRPRQGLAYHGGILLAQHHLPVRVAASSYPP
ncbi:hypothetical protein ACA910_001817 [Epithemia clementina (nom. ined.)]